MTDIDLRRVPGSGRPEDPAARTARLRALAEDASARFAELERELDPAALADAASAWAAETFGDRLAVACSMADAVLPAVVATRLPGVDVLFLDTGYHFPETMQTRDRVARELPVTVVDVQPRRTVPQQDAEFGARLHDRDPAACCRMRKVEPLREALAGYDAWVTGVRREEGPTRAGTPVVTYDESFDLVKVNPLVTWSFDQIGAYEAEHGLPRNPLLDRGYPSIGCLPCTRPVAPGEDPRAGRWAGFSKTECGLHPGGADPADPQADHAADDASTSAGGEGSGAARRAAVHPITTVPALRGIGREHEGPTGLERIASDDPEEDR